MLEPDLDPPESDALAELDDAIDGAKTARAHLEEAEGFEVVPSDALTRVLEALDAYVAELRVARDRHDPIVAADARDAWDHEHQGLGL